MHLKALLCHRRSCKTSTLASQARGAQAVGDADALTAPEEACEALLDALLRQVPQRPCAWVRVPITE